MFLLKVSESKDLELIFRMRYEAYKEKGWINPFGYENECETDRYDKVSRHFMVKDDSGEKVICSFRLIYPINEMNLPIQDEFDLKIPPAQITQCLEFSRFIVNKSYRGPARLHEIMDLICSSPNLEDIKYIYATIEVKFLKILNYFGYPFIVLGEGKYYSSYYKIPTMVYMDDIS